MAAELSASRRGGTSQSIPAGGAYAGSKAAIEQFSNCLAKELGARGITVNTIAPGVTTTDGLLLGQEQIQLLASHIYEGVISKPDDATLRIEKGDRIHFAEFRVTPENQPRLIDLEQQNVEIALEHPDLISANFHRSLDGTRTANCGQWRSLDNLDALLKEPKYEPVREYWKGLAENEFHLYEVVFIQPLE